jgi:hypothetical protein
VRTGYVWLGGCGGRGRLRLEIGGLAVEAMEEGDGGTGGRSPVDSAG